MQLRIQKTDALLTRKGSQNCKYSHSIWFWQKKQNRKLKRSRTIQAGRKNEEIFPLFNELFHQVLDLILNRQTS